MDMEAYAKNISSDYIYHETPTTCFTVRSILRRIRMKVSGISGDECHLVPI